MMQAIDFHCDTPSRFFAGKNGESVRVAAGPDSTKNFDFYLQCSAFFCPSKADDESGYRRVLAMMDLWRETVKNPVKCQNTLKNALLKHKTAYIYAIEDARILAGDLTRVDTLFARGVRILTPLWRGESVIGGAWDKESGLSPFGKAAVERFLSLGGLADVSHASRRAHEEILALCRAFGRAPLATHSNAFALTPHRRNLDDAQIREIGARGGVIGLNFCPAFLTSAKTAVMDDLCAHLRHIFRVGGTDAAVLGSDLDGVDALPDGIATAADLPSFAEYLHARGFAAAEIDAFFFENGKRYLLENLPQGTDV